MAETKWTVETVAGLSEIFKYIALENPVVVRKIANNAFPGLLQVLQKT